RAVPHDAHVAGRYPEFGGDLARRLVRVEREREDGAVHLGELGHALLEALGVERALGGRGGVSHQSRAKALEQLRAPAAVPAPGPERHTAGAEDERAHALGPLDAPGTVRLDHDEQDLLREVFGRVEVAQVAAREEADLRGEARAKVGLDVAHGGGSVTPWRL